MKINKLQYWLKSTAKLFKDFKSLVLDGNDPKKRRIFIDRGSDVLFVAHIDTVQKPKYIRQRKTKTGKQKRIYAQGLDDRLGCMIAYELSKEFNIDLLICDNEEQGKSTGQYHKLKDYNWIAEFDRAGKDVVTYDLDSAKFKSALSDYWEIGFGSFSDVCQLKTNVCCVNIGIGYEFAHSKDSYVCIKTLNKQIEKFKQFYAANKDIVYIQECIPIKDVYIWDDSEYHFDRTIGKCELCGLSNNIDYIFGHIICEDCFEAMYAEYADVMWDRI